MTLKPWEKIGRSAERKNDWWTYRKDDVRLPSGKAGEYHYVHVNGSSMVVPILGDGRMVLVNQYRYLAKRESIEFPCGSVKDGATYEETARRELAEETGYDAGDLVCVAGFNPYNGVTDEFCKVFVATRLSPVNAVPDDTEEFEKIVLTSGEFDEMIKSGAIWDGMSLAAWAILKTGGFL